MIQPDHLDQLSWPYFNNMYSSLHELGIHELGMDAYMDHHELISPPFTSMEESPDISLISDFPAIVSADELNFVGNADKFCTALPMDVFTDLDLKESEPFLNCEIENISAWLNESEASFPSEQINFEGEDEWSNISSLVESSDAAMDITLIQPSLTLPTESMETDNKLGIIHLVKAYGEAVEKEQAELAEVIMKRISEKVSPVADIVERLLYYVFQASDRQAEYLRQESYKNFEAAFKAFYQIFPYGRFAHFAANSAILEAIPRDAEAICIVDFDMGDGVQWASFIEAIGRTEMPVRLMSIKWKEDHQDCACAPSRWRFEETKRWLGDHARSLCLNLKVDQMELQNLVSDMKKMKKRGGRKEWLAFNCMVGLPHMGRQRSRINVLDFLRTGKELITNSANCSTINKGIITLGDADAWEKLRNCSGFECFFDGYLAHYQALLESMEWNFPVRLAEARIAMECLFVAPYVSSTNSWFQNWEDMKECCDFSSGLGLEGWKISKENLMEAKEMVREGESLYGVRVEGEAKNEMVLEWRGTPLVRVSTWR